MREAVLYSKLSVPQHTFLCKGDAGVHVWYDTWPADSLLAAQASEAIIVSSMGDDDGGP